MSEIVNFGVNRVENTKKMTHQEFEIFAQRCRGKMVATARHYLAASDEAEDVVQEAMLKLFVMRQRLGEFSRPEAFAMVVVKHLALNLLRGRGRHRMTSIDSVPLTSEEFVDDGRLGELLSTIDTLPSKQQIVLRLKHIEGMEVEEIAETVQMSQDAVYQNLSRARRAILNKFKTKEL
ncbi:MAG: sigma-70 family RNA polymerase sigma factor [Alistipes sp.]|nr:sigma-70 family RNA polymerase sigma factor [Alistipes sp.]